MNSKIPFHQLSAMLAEKCAISAAEAEDFVRGFFDLVTESLIEGHDVKIKGIGTFRRSDDTEQPVEFIPDAALADGINSPFAMFEPEELSPEVTDSLLAAEDTPPAETSENVPLAETTEPVIETVVSADEANEITETVIELPEIVEETTVVTTAVPESIEIVAESTVAVPESTDEAIESTVAAPKTTEETVESTVPAPKTAEDTDESAPVDDALVETTVEPSVETPVEAPVETVSESVAEVAQPEATITKFADEEDEYLAQPEHTNQGSWGWGFVVGLLVGMAIGACAVYFAIDYFFPNSKIDTELAQEADAEAIAETEAMLAELQAQLPTDTVSTESPVANNETVDAVAPATPAETPAPVAETKEQPAPAAEAAPVKDTVKAGYLLPTMARKHYGDKSFWVYIYEENKGIISNPNRIRPGLTVVIPPASKYGIDARNSESIRRAKDKAAEILKKYPN